MRRRKNEINLMGEKIEVNPLKFYALSPRYRYIVKLRLGLDGEKKHTFEEIAVRIGVKRQRAWELYHRAMKKMRSE